MIFVGCKDDEKRIEIERYKDNNDIKRVVIISPDEFPLAFPESDQNTYKDIIQYVTFYRLLQEINQQTLVVLNECLQTQNRYELNYSCLRSFLNQTSHQLIFQQLPQIDTIEDFMILFDFDTRSRWKREKFNLDLIFENCNFHIKLFEFDFIKVDVPTKKLTKDKYDDERERLFSSLGIKDPHTLPRNLYLIGRKDKLSYIDSLDFFWGEGSSKRWVSRSNCGNRENVISYNDVGFYNEYGIVELPHRFIDFSNFLKKTWQTKNEVLVADLKVDDWYFNRYTRWKERIDETYSSLLKR